MNDRFSLRTTFIPVCALFMFFLLLVAGCSKESSKAFEGSWQRWVKVPEGMQGRCYFETLTIRKAVWHLDVIVHSSFECNQPTLGLAFQGKVKDRLQPAEGHWVLNVAGIRLIGMQNITQGQSTPLPSGALSKMSVTLLPEEHTRFSQQLLVRETKELSANLFPVTRNLAIPGYPDDFVLLAYEERLPIQKH